MAFRARKVFETFEKQAPDPHRLASGSGPPFADLEPPSPLPPPPPPENKHSLVKIIKFKCKLIPWDPDDQSKETNLASLRHQTGTAFFSLGKGGLKIDRQT